MPLWYTVIMFTLSPEYEDDSRITITTHARFVRGLTASQLRRSRMSGALSCCPRRHYSSQRVRTEKLYSGDALDH